MFAAHESADGNSYSTVAFVGSPAVLLCGNGQ
jgi:hypothetical protein